MVPACGVGACSLRYNVLVRRVIPYLKVGYGLSWYRLEGTTVNGNPTGEPNSPWVRQPSIFPLSNLLPNTWHLGAGFEVFVIRSRRAAFPEGLDLAVKVDWKLLSHHLGLDFDDVPVEDLIGLGLPANALPRDRRVLRNVFQLGLTLSF